jgi:DNA-binding transcriptional ArsR family regulator
MARAATTTDAFNAVAEPRRRQILDLLATAELPVGDLVERLGMAQPQVSKHLAVLRQVGLVEVREAGRQSYEQFWSERFARLDTVLAELRAAEADDAGQQRKEDGDDESGR